MTRLALPNRRPSVVLEAEWESIPFSVTIGFDPATAMPRAVFADTLKGGQMQATLADTCVLISLALQYGIPAVALAKSLSRVPDVMEGGGAEKHGSPIGVIVALIGGLE
jgi:hypothetical protein